MKKIYAALVCLLGIINSLVYSQITKQFEETSYYMKGISFIDTLTGWTVGSPHWDQVSKTYMGTIIKTTDGAKTWNAQNAGTSNSLRKVQFIDANNGWVVGENGTILNTFNGGNTWTKQTISTTDEIRCLKFINSSTGWVISLKPVHYDYWGEIDNWQSTIWKTTNGGTNWIKETISDSASILNGIDFVDSQNGWAVGIKYAGIKNNEVKKFGAVYHTTDGGHTWKEQKVPKPPTVTQFVDSVMIFTGVDFVNSQIGWATGFMGSSAVEGKTLYHTSDGGLTWKQDTCSAITGNLWDVQFIDENRGYIVGTLYGAAWGPPVLRTMDGGLHWQIVKMGKQDGEGLYGLAVFNKKVIAVGDHDYIAKSYDPWGTYGFPLGENIFTQKYLNPHYSFEDIYFTDTMNGWAAGKIFTYPDSAGQIIMHTSNGGNTWQSQYVSEKDFPSGTPRLDKISFTDSLTGWVFGGASFMWGKGNYILHTTDGGKHWISQDATIPNSKRELYSGIFINNTTGWALEQGNLYPGYYLTLLKTTNGGSNWTRVNTNVSGGSAGWGVGFGLVQGDIFFTDSQNGWAGGYSGGVIHTTDGGLTWIKQNYPLYADCNAIFFTSSIEGWATNAGGLQFTNDGGNTWSEKSLYSLLGDYARLNDIQFINSQNGWVVGDVGTILHTSDKGTTWDNLKDISNTSSNLLGLQFVNDSIGWAAGNEGVILNINSKGIKLPQTITLNTLPNLIYGDADFNPGATASSGLSVYYSVLDTTIATIKNGKVHIKNAGHTILYAYQPGNSIYRAAPEVIDEFFYISSKNLFVTADNKTRKFGEPNPEFTISYNGFVNGENASILDVVPTAATSATDSSVAGNYAITVSGGSDNNYSLIYINGTLTITSLTDINSISTIVAKVYPNPFTDNLTIRIESEGTGKYTLTSISGSVLEEHEISSNETKIGLSYLKSGVYLLCVTINGKIQNFRIVKQ